MKFSALIYAVALSGSVFASVVCAAAEGQVKDLNQIIRGLAPLEYLREHSGKAPRASIDLDIRFAVDKATLLPEARAQLRELGRALQSPKLRGKKVEIAGHTDASGPAAHNKALSLLRAEAVAAYLRREFKIEPARLTVAGYGEERLKDPGQPVAAVNRRVEISAVEPSTNAPLFASATGGDRLESGTWGNLMANADRADDVLRRAQTQGKVRVIVGLSAPQRSQRRAQGRVNLNDYIRGLQDTAIDTLGWKNINNLVRYEYTPAMAMTVDAARFQELLSSNAVSEVFEDQLHVTSLKTSVPLIGVQRSRSEGQSLGGYAVAILDTGVDSDHPFLAKNVVAEACFSSDVALPDLTIRSSCPSGKNTEIGVGAARPCDPAYGCSHGTHVAGIAAGWNGEFSGVAPTAAIVAVQVFSLIDAPECGKCTGAFTSDVLRALEWVYQNHERLGIVALNLSLGGGRFWNECDDGSPYAEILDLITQSNVAAVIASGNEGHSDSVTSPACVSSAVSVGATTYQDKIAPFSNSAETLDFLAPGAVDEKMSKDNGILSSIPGTSFQRQAGTSMAAPHVAGAFVILKSAVRKATLPQMLQALRETGLQITDTRNGITRPRIQLNAAIAYLRKHLARGGKLPSPEPKNYDGIRVYKDGEDTKKPFKW